MDTILIALSYPFMIRAIAAGIIVSILLASIGVIATLRNMTFFGDGIAHASLAGVALALFAGWVALPVALLWAIIVAIGIYFIERKTHLSSDVLIGIFFTSSMAVGVILMHFTSGYQPELLSYLFGNLLTVHMSDLWVTAVLGTAIIVWLRSAYRGLIYLSLHENAARVHGIQPDRYLLPFYISTAIAIVLGVKLMGIVLISALLVLPAATSRVLTTSFRNYVMGALALSMTTVIAGLLLSYTFDLPSGAMIVLVGSMIFFTATVVKPGS